MNWRKMAGMVQEGEGNDGSANRDRTGTRSSPPVLPDFRSLGPGRLLPWCPEPGGDRRLRLPLLRFGISPIPSDSHKFPVEGGLIV